MNKIKKLMAIILTAAMLMAAFPVMAEEADEPTEASEKVESMTEIQTEDEATAEPEATEEPLETIDTAENETSEPEIMALAAADEESEYPYTEQPVPEGEYITNTYGYPIQGDPYNTKRVKQGIDYSHGNRVLHGAYWLRDTDFFGVWDENTQKWTTASKLDYDKYPGLERVENAAKAGDYEYAKLAYYNYYVEKEKEIGRTQVISDTKKDRITADLLCKNFMYNANSGITPLDIMNVGNTPQYRGVDVASTITQYLGTREYAVFWILATDKNGDWVDFSSKEGENTPFLRLRVDGAEKIIYPTADTNIKAGSNRTKNYGSDTVLTAREDEFGVTNYSHNGVSDTTHLHVNENTSRIYMKFDVSDLRAGDNIESATLNLYGNNHVEGQEKELVIFYSDDSNWDENALTYGNATAQVIYSYDQAKSWWWNQPLQAGYRYQEELLRFNTWFDKLVKLYHYTGDEKYAYTAIRQFMDYINVRGDDICWLKSLDTAVRTQCMPGLWLQLLDSQYMSPEVFTAFMKWCYVQGTGAKAFNTSGNWGTSESLGLYTLTINFPEFTDSIEWLNRVRERYESLSNAMTKADYACTELSLGYTDYTITTLLDAKTVAEDIHVDMDEFSPYTQRTLDNIEHLGLFMYWSSLPGVSDNQVGDGYSHRGNFKSRMLSLGEWFDNEQLLYAATDGKDGKAPEFTSKLFPNGKKSIFRTNWTDKAMYMFTDVDGGVGNHAHPDDNNIVIAAHGQYLLVDPLYGTYSTSTAKTWLTSSIAHNLVVMNGKNQTTGSSSVGTIPKWESNDLYDFVTTSAKSTPDASEYKRTTFFYRDKLFLVNDYLVPKNASQNKYVQAWHYLPEAGITMDEESKIVKTNFLGPNIQVVPIGIDKFTRAENVDGLYSESQGSISNAKYTEYEKRNTGTTVFNTLLLPENTGEDYEVSSGEVEIEGMTGTDASAVEIYLTNKDTGEMTHYIYYLLNDLSKKASVTVEGFTTDAAMMFIEMDYKGNVKYIAVRDATVLKEGSKKLFKSDSELADFSAKWDYDYCTVSGTDLTASNLKANNVEIQSGAHTPKEAQVNGEDAAFKAVDGVMYFGTVPSGEPGATPTPTVKPTSKPVHGGGSGGGGGSVRPPVTTPVPPTSTPEETPEPTQTPSGTMNESLKAELENHWAKDEVTYLYEQGIVQGQTETSFGLENQITRAEFVTLLARATGLEPVEYSGAFTDVKADDWYSGYIEAAYQKGIIKGADGAANPNARITREEAAKMLSAILADDGIGEAEFGDADQISDWAKDAVDIVVKNGLMKGRDNGSFDPKAGTKRCEAFAIIYRMVE